jgi:RNA-directed DNA polymerase
MNSAEVIINETKEERILSINTIDELAEHLGYSSKDLQRIAKAKRHYYRVKENIDSSGKVRKFCIALGPLSRVLDSIKKRLLNRIELPECIHGYRKGHSCMTNAKPHVWKNVIFQFDIKNFFPSIHPVRVANTFLGLGFAEKVAKLLTHLVTCDHELPHGFATSPMLSNIIVSNLARKLQGLCSHYNLTLTMYSDDITISGNIEQKKSEKLFKEKLLPKIKEIMEQEGFSLNFGKIKLVKRKESQKVTGIVVNRKPNIPKQKRRELLFTIKEYQTNGIPIKQDFDVSKLRNRLRGQIANAQSVNRPFGQYLLCEFEKIDWSRLIVSSN